MAYPARFGLSTVCAGVDKMAGMGGCRVPVGARTYFMPFQTREYVFLWVYFEVLIVLADSKNKPPV